MHHLASKHPVLNPEFRSAISLWGVIELEMKPHGLLSEIVIRKLHRPLGSLGFDLADALV